MVWNFHSVEKVSRNSRHHLAEGQIVHGRKNPVLDSEINFLDPDSRVTPLQVHFNSCLLIKSQILKVSHGLANDKCSFNLHPLHYLLMMKDEQSWKTVITFF